ncbi:MAG TPA: DUF262 domain-containing HNH endonuclease family protein [Limnochordia bacterium]|nr:DUF262 domain-containing HNH endonuclease family protein [Limnochordia bacterium]
MIRSVKDYPISQLLDVDSNITYYVPKYQREYIWGKEEWEYLFDDLQENNPGYFLGSFICINQSGDTLAVQRLELVDGQQRLVTLSLLLAAIYKFLQTHYDALNEEQRYGLYHIRRRLVLKDEPSVRIRPQMQNNNEQDYLAVLRELGILANAPPPRYWRSRRIYRAYSYFEERVRSEAGAAEDPIKFVMDFLSRVNQAVMVKIEVETVGEAYVLFESLNNRGVPLTAIDLIKNKLLATMEFLQRGAQPEVVDHAFRQWNTLLQYIGDDYRIQERFFRHYYNAFRGDLKDIYAVPVATRSNLMHIYERLIDHDAPTFLEKISEAGRYYGVLLNRTEPDEPGEREELCFLRKPLLDLERVQGTPAYQLLLHLLLKREELQLDYGHVASMIRFLVRFFARRNLTDTPPTRDLTRLFMGIIDQLSGLTGDGVVTAIYHKLVAVSADDAEFRKRLNGPIYEENAGVTRFILCSIAEQGMTRENEVDLWRLDKNRYVWTIEHVLPQGANLPRSWVEMIADGDEEKAREYQQNYAHKLGNLTISAYNRELGNKSFLEKRDRKDERGNFVGYKNQLNLNEDLANCSEWTIDRITARTERLIELVMDLFKLELD